MTQPINENITTIQRAALVAGFGLLIMVLTVPFAEFSIIPSLVNYGDATETLQNIQNNPLKFQLAISLYLITFIMDVFVAWALYVFLRPVSVHLSLLTAWMRIVYTVIALAATLNLINVTVLTRSSTYLKDLENILPSLIMAEIQSFGWQWSFSLLLFGIYLLMLGYLVFKASYIPRVMGVLLMVSGLGYILDTIGIFFFPGINRDLLMITFFGELIFMLWLLIKGWRVNELYK